MKFPINTYVTDMSGRRYKCWTFRRAIRKHGDIMLTNRRLLWPTTPFFEWEIVTAALLPPRDGVEFAKMEFAVGRYVLTFSFFRSYDE